MYAARLVCFQGFFCFVLPPARLCRAVITIIIGIVIICIFLVLFNIPTRLIDVIDI